MLEMGSARGGGRVAAGAALGLLGAFLSSTAIAQQSGPGLPPVTVEPPAPRRAAPRVVQPAARPAPTRASVRRGRTHARTVASSRAPAPTMAPAGPAVEPAGPVERANGPVGGMVARRSATGTKTDTPILEVPQSISVIPREQMDQQQAESVSQALRYSASISPEVRPANNRYDSIFIRGFGGGGTAAAYVNYWDGMRVLRGVNFLVPAIDPYSLERIEVLRGPASVLFGQVNVGGLVNMVSKRPTETPVREIQLQTGSYGRLQTAFDLGGPADPDGKFLYRLTGLFRDADTQVAHTKEQRIMIAPSFTWKPDETLKLTVYGHYQRDPETGFYGTLPVVGTLLPTKFGRIPTRLLPGEPGFEGFSRNMSHIGYEIEHKPTDGVTLRQNLRFVDMDSKFTTVAAVGMSANQEMLQPRRATYSREFARGLVLDNQAQFDFTTGPLTHKLLLGLDYLDVGSHSYLGTGGTVQPLNWRFPIYGRTPFVLPATPRTNQDQSQLGLYAQDQIKFDRFVLTAGLRQDWADTKQYVYNTNKTTKFGDDALTGRVGLVYLFDWGLAPYASYATSFDPLTSGTSYSGTPFRPTTGEQYEAGVKFQPVGYDAFIQASAFDLTQNNVTTPDPNHFGYSIQTGQIRSRGVEVEARATIAKSLDLIAAYSTMDVEVTRANDASLGHRPVGAPAQIASGWAYYTFHDGWLAGLGFGGGVRYIGNTLGQADGTLRVPGYTLYDAAVSYDFGKASPYLKGLKLAVNGTNLADKTYVSGCFSYLQGCVYGYRRAVLATLTYRW